METPQNNLEVQQAVDTITTILRAQPHAIHGKANPLIDWTGDINLDELLPNRAQAIGGASGLFDVYFKDGAIYEGPGFAGIVSTTAGNTDATYIAAHPSKYLEAQAGKSVADRFLPFTNCAQHPDPDEDVFIASPDSPFFAFGWIPSRESIGNVRSNRNFLWGTIDDPKQRARFIDAVGKAAQVDPGFFYEHVLPQLFPQAFNPNNITPETVATLFSSSHGRLASYLRDRGISAEKLIPKLFPDNNGVGKSPQGVAQKQGFWDKIRGKSEPSITSNKTKDEVLAKIDESLYEKYSRLKDFLHNRAGQIPELALDQQAITDFLAGLPSAIEADVNTDPQPYIDTIRDHATPHRQAPCTSLTMIDLTQSP